MAMTVDKCIERFVKRRDCKASPVREGGNPFVRASLSWGTPGNHRLVSAGGLLYSYAQLIAYWNNDNTVRLDCRKHSRITLARQETVVRAAQKVGVPVVCEVFPGSRSYSGNARSRNAKLRKYGVIPDVDPEEAGRIVSWTSAPSALRLGVERQRIEEQIHALDWRDPKREALYEKSRKLADRIDRARERDPVIKDRRKVADENHQRFYEKIQEERDKRRKAGVVARREARMLPIHQRKVLS